jgi:hypothetical protein
MAIEFPGDVDSDVTPQSDAEVESIILDEADGEDDVDDGDGGGGDEDEDEDEDEDDVAVAMAAMAGVSGGGK